ncbi:PREDICTED: A-kinase anchor protein 17A isoform X2 [Vollenhovia emeryi]|nr:PREDICTED: A-kinase anchor protein 17A isoform X2 [Vollenhovia emeryi]XP_011877687.1 PREDICTED: A-kinase anchor protein 17A isoform X2 [Vollenhovia emeryi]XP_011877688.1 PREDICTED: A-kinase anchor protein 17A isoform X2 [Vollenhovia emeryi]
MEKIRALILPDEFASLKVAKSTLEFIRLEGDLRDRCRLLRVLARLDLQHLNLAGFPNVLKVRAAEAKDDFPNRHSWNSYFRDAKHMNELKAGERPDTIHITGLPVKWFTEDNASVPSEALVTKIFKKWGTLRRVDVPAADTYRSRMRLGNNIHKFSYEDGIFFDVYVQYVEYMDFVRAMDALRGMKLLKKDGQNSLTATIKVDFDKTKHMSDSSVSHRDFERKRLIAQDNLAAEKLRKREEAEKKRLEELKKKEETDSLAKTDRRQKREEKRKRKALTKFRKQEEDKVSMKIAREEQKLIKAQRQLESIRLLDELFDRIKTKVEKKEIKLNQNIVKKNETKNDQTSENAKKVDSENDKKNKDKQIKKKKTKKEKKNKKKRKKTQKKRKKGDDSASGSTTEEESDKETSKKKLKSVLIKNGGATSSTGAVSTTNLPYDYSDSISMQRIPMLPFHTLRMSKYGRSQMIRSPMSEYSMSIHHPMLPVSRGRGFPRYEMNYALTNPYLYNGQYYEYFTNLVERDTKRKSRVRDRRKSRSRSISRTRTKSRSKTKSRSVSGSRSRRRNNSRSKSRGRRSKSRSRSRSRRSRSRSRKSRSRSRRSRSRSRKSRSRSHRSRSRSKNRSRSRDRRKSTSRSASRKRTRSRSSSKTKRKNDKSSRSKSNSRTRRSRSRRKSRSRSKSRNRNRYRGKRGERLSSVVRVTRAKSRPTSPRRRSPSSSWSMPKSPGRRSCSWSRTASANNINEQDVNKKSEEPVQEETTKTTETQKETN